MTHKRAPQRNIECENIYVFIINMFLYFVSLWTYLMNEDFVFTHYLTFLNVLFSSTFQLKFGIQNFFKKVIVRTIYCLYPTPSIYMWLIEYHLKRLIFLRCLALIVWQKIKCFLTINISNVRKLRNFNDNYTKSLAEIPAIKKHFKSS